MIPGFVAPTPKQRAYVAALQAKLRIPTPALDRWCREQYGVPLDVCDRATMSRLLDELVTWETMPAALRRALGQAVLPGFEDEEVA